MKLSETLSIPAEELEKFENGLFLGELIKDFDRDDLLAMVYRYVTYEEDRMQRERQSIQNSDNWFNRLRGKK